MAVSITALFVALGGTGYAALSFPKNSVGTKQLKNGAVSTAKLKNGAVTKAKLNVAGVTVPNALRAGSASIAINANRADSASNAGHASNSDQLGGAPPAAFQDKCPAGTVSAATDLCVTSSDVATDSWFNAVDDCASRGMRVPSPAEAALLGHTTSPGYHWTDDFWYNGTSAQAMPFYRNPDHTVGLDNIDAVGDAVPVVCVITPSNS
jgi:hypothetical protein